MRVVGKVAVRVESQPLLGARLVVLLEDVTLIDAAATEVARFERRGIDADVGTTLDLPFELAFTPSPARLGLRAWLDADGDGRAGLGDYASVQSYPVDGLDPGGPIRMSLRPI